MLKPEGEKEGGRNGGKKSGSGSEKGDGVERRDIVVRGREREKRDEGNK